MKEIKTTMFMTETNKAAGPYSIHVEFYQASWDIIKEDIMETFIEFDQGTLDIQRLNYGIITILPNLRKQ